MHDSISPWINTNSSYGTQNLCSRSNGFLLNIFSNTLDQTTQECNSDSSNPGGYTKLIFGSGTTPATIEDYCIESQITTGISILSRNIIGEYDISSGLYKNYLVTTCRADSDLKITEVGLVKSIIINPGQYNWNNTTSYANVLALRELLSNPLNLSAGDTFSITIEYSM
jgi:hypothetical protein